MFGYRIFLNKVPCPKDKLRTTMIITRQGLLVGAAWYVLYFKLCLRCFKGQKVALLNVLNCTPFHDIIMERFGIINYNIIIIVCTNVYTSITVSYYTILYSTIKQ